jgi:alkaline phosphatase
MDNEIMEHMVYQDIDVVFGGGKRHLLPEEVGGKRKDGENLLEVLLNRGYQWVETRDEMLAQTSGKVWGLFADSHMEPDIDRWEFAREQPSLAEMTAKAIDLLSQDQDGFFLMVEGSQVDWAGHANDPIYMVTDFLAFDEAVQVALDFAKKDKHTLVLAFPDHNTGALSIGSGHTPIAYTDTNLDDVLAPLREMKITSAGLVKKIGEDASDANIMANIAQWWGIQATDEDLAEIRARVDVEGGDRLSLGYAIAETISKNHTLFGWTTHGHTGEDVPLWSYGPNRPVGLYDNTGLAGITADALRFSLQEMNRRLFVDVAEVFPDYELDLTGPENPVLKVRGAEMPISKDRLKTNGKEYDLEGLVVYAPMTEKVYIPREAVRLIRKGGWDLPRR